MNVIHYEDRHDGTLSAAKRTRPVAIAALAGLLKLDEPSTRQVGCGRDNVQIWGEAERECGAYPVCSLPVNAMFYWHESCSVLTAATRSAQRIARDYVLKHRGMG